MTWRACRVDYHEPKIGSLLTEAIAPALSSLRARDPLQVVLRPHWMAGPHVTIAVRSDAATFRHQVMPVFKMMIGDWLERNPSLRSLDAETYFAQSRAWATAESMQPPSRILRRNNGITVARYRRPQPMNLSELADIRDEFLSDTLDVQLAACALKEADSRRYLIQLMRYLVLIGQVRLDGRYSFWPVSYKAHAKIFFFANPSAGERASQNAAQWRSVLAPMFQSLWGEGGDANLTELERSWLNALRRSDERASAVIDRNFSQVRDYDFRRSEENDPIRIANPLNLTDKDMGMFKTKCHIAYRFLVNILYLSLPTMMVSPKERAICAYLISDCIDEIFPERLAAARSRLQDLLREAEAMAA
jgi:hypothetical protein